MEPGNKAKEFTEDLITQNLEILKLESEQFAHQTDKKKLGRL